MSEGSPPAGESPTANDRNASNNDNSNSNNNSNSNSNAKEQEWFFPSFSRSPFRSWTEIVNPQKNLIGILANKVVDGMHKNLDPDGPAIQKLLDEHLPRDKESVRTKLPFYESTVDALKHQRDNYLLGSQYASKKTVHRDRARRLFPASLPFGAPGSPRMPRDSTALGYVQIVHLGSWFVPSFTIKESLLPIVVSLPSVALRDTITYTVVNAIPLAQPPLDTAMKNAVMGVIRDPKIRQMIKSRTQKILRTDENENDDESEKERTLSRRKTRSNGVRE